jgi:hypothetical protein
LPELEIISLLEEQLPVYRLRADTIFGYEQDDWLHTPLTTPDTALLTERFAWARASRPLHPNLH